MRPSPLRALTRRLRRRRRSTSEASAVLRWHSVSSTREYEGCPRRYRYGYLDRRPQDRPVPSSWRFGSVVHEGLEAAYRHAMEQPGSSGAERSLLAAAAIDVSCERHELLEEPAARQRAVWQTTRALTIDAVGTSDAGRILGVEEVFRDRFSATDGIVGIADLVLRRRDGAVEIVDHKVTWHHATPEELCDDFQLNLYGYLARRRWPEAKRIIGTHHYPTGPAVVSTRLDDEGMLAAVARLRVTAERIEADTEFAPTPSTRCHGCPWQPSCPEGTAYLREAS